MRHFTPILPISPITPAASRAFTLTDLTVLSAILSLVCSITFVALARSKAASQLGVCTANVGKVSGAVLSYAADNGQSLPRADAAAGGTPWWWYKEQVKSYAGLRGPSGANDFVFACPDDRGYSDPVPFHLSARFDFNSYVFNGVTLPGMPNIAGLALAEIKHPKQTLLVMEWTAHAPLSWHKSKTGQRNMPFYCDAQSVLGFADGHASFNKIYYDGCNAAYTRDPVAGYDYQYSAK